MNKFNIANPDKITSLQFPLTPAMREYMDLELSRLRRLASMSTHFDVLLGGSLAKNFNVVLKTHFLGKDLVAHELGDEFHNVFKSALHLLKRQIVDLKRKKFKKR